MNQQSEQGKTKQEYRLVEIYVGEEKLELNGFVMDLFQETICGMVRALGTHDTSKTIKVIIKER